MASVGRTARGSWLAVALVVALAGCASNPGRTPLPASTQGDRSQDFLAMGDRAAAAGELTTAAAFYQQAAGRMGDNVVALIRLGEVYLRDRRWPEAADVFARAIRLDGSQLTARRGYAHALIAMGQPASALAQLEEVLRATPGDLRALNLEAVAHDMIGQPDEAAATYRRALALAPGDPRLEGNLALSRALAGDYATAIPILERLAGRTDATPRTRQNLALVYALAGDLAAARRTGLLDLDPASVERNIAFVVQLREGERSEAARALLSANGGGQGAGNASEARRGRARATAADAPRPLIPEASAAEPVTSAPRITSTPANHREIAAEPAAIRGEPSAADRPAAAVAAAPQVADSAEEPGLVAGAPRQPTATAMALAAAAPAPTVDDGTEPSDSGRATGAPVGAAEQRAPVPVAPFVLSAADADAVARVVTNGDREADSVRALPPSAEPIDARSFHALARRNELLGSTSEPAPAAGVIGVATALPVAPIVLPETAAMPNVASFAAPAAAEHALAAVDAPDVVAGPVDLPAAPSAAANGAVAANWLVSLGAFADADAALAEWRSLKARHGDLLNGLTRLGHAADGTQPLLAGPIRDEATAIALCRRLAARGVGCSTQRI